MRSLTIMFFVTAVMVGCTKVSEQQLVLDAEAQELCTKDTISFSDHIAPLVQINCMPCHNSTQAEGSIVLETYDEIKGIAEADELLLHVIRHDPGYLPMPKDRPRLKDCEIRAFEVWVAQGRLNN